MAKVKFDVSSTDAEESVSGGGKQATPGVYTAKIKSIETGYAKGSDGPDKSRPMLIVVVTPTKPNGKPGGYSDIWDYIVMTSASEWKLDQFLQAVGIATKRKRKGEFDTAKLVGKLVKIRVKSETYEGEMRAKLGSYLLKDEDSDDAETEEEDWDEAEELDEDLDELEEDDEEEEEDDDEEESDEESDEELYQLEDLNDMDLAQLKAVLTEEGIDRPKGRTSKSKLIALLTEEGLVEAADEEDPF